MCVKPRKSNVSGLPDAPRLPIAGRRTARTRSAASCPGAAPSRTSRTARAARPGTARHRLGARNPTTKSSAYRTMITSPRACRPPPVRPTGRRRSGGRRSRAAARPMPPAATPPSSADHSPSSMTPALSHFRMQPQDPLVRDPVLEELLQPAVIELVEEVADVRVEHPVHLLPLDPDRERVQRIMRAAPRPEPVGEAQEVRLVDGVEHLDDRPLDDLVLQRGDAERPLPPVRLRDVRPPRRPRPVAPRCAPGRAGPGGSPPGPARRPPTSPRPPPARPSG